MDEMDESRVGETYERRYAFAGVERRGVGGVVLWEGLEGGGGRRQGRLTKLAKPRSYYRGGYG